MSFPLVSDLKCWISYHLSLDLHFAHIPTLPPPVLSNFIFLLSLFFFPVRQSCMYPYRYSLSHFLGLASVGSLGRPSGQSGHGEMDRIRGVLMSLLMCHARSVVGL
jgi:hypothetical protein